jgi:hypothetical protein
MRKQLAHTLHINTSAKHPILYIHAVTGRGGPYGCETSRFPHFLDNRLTDGGEFVSLTRRPPFYPQEDSWYLFLLEVESTTGP